MQAPVVAYREPARRYDKQPEVLYIFEHKTQYIF